MPPKIKVNAKTDQGCDYFETTFFDGSEEAVGNLLKRLFEAAGWAVKERRPDGKTIIWEVQLPYGDIVTDKTISTINYLMDEVTGHPV